MKRKVVLISLALLGLTAAITFCFVRLHNHTEIQVRQTERSPDGRWTAVVQMEVYNAGGVVNDAVYAVRLKGPSQKDRQGDLVMNVPVNYPAPAPSVKWSDGKLVVTLADHEKYQYFATPVGGVAVAVQQK